MYPMNEFQMSHDWRQVVTRRREQMSLSQRELAAAAGVSEKTVYNLESGTGPRAGTLRKILNALGLSSDYETARDQVLEAASRLDTVFVDTNVLLGIAQDDVELKKFIEQLTAMLDLMPRHKRRDVMDDILNDVLRVLRKTQPYSASRLGKQTVGLWDALPPKERARATELYAKAAAASPGGPPNVAMLPRPELLELTELVLKGTAMREGVNLNPPEFHLAAHDEDHTIESEQGHADHA